MLLIGSASERTLGKYDDVDSSIQMTLCPAATDARGTRSLSGTWDFVLSSGERPPTSSSRLVTPDLSSGGNDGTLGNEPPIVTDPAERTLDLTNEGFVAVGDARGVDSTEPVFMIQLTFKYVGNESLYSKGNQYALGIWGDQLSFWMAGDGNWPGINAGNLSRGRWYTTTLVVDENEIRLYLDAVEIGSASHDFSSLSTPTHCFT